MKIVHIAPNAPYNDYWGYQENLLPKYQKKLGHDVTLIVSNKMHKDGKIINVDCDDYVLDDGVRVVRLKAKQYCNNVLTNLNSHLPVFEYLADIKPDFVFYHGLHGTTIFEVIKYKNTLNPHCIIVQDNHLDYNIRNDPKGIKGMICRSFQRWVNRQSVPYVSKVYGVTPWRKTYAEDYYGIPPEKTDVLIMGADDEKVHLEHKTEIRKSIRSKYRINDKDFLIVTGGKIDKKKKIDILMKAIEGMDDVKLLIFGQVSDDLKEKFDSILRDNKNIVYVGWIGSDEVYNYFFAADLVFFPGQHSVLWEQACASKVPCVFEKWEGMDHVDNGGNSDFVEPITEEKIKKKILELKYTDRYFRMKSIAESKKTDIYLYSKIAEKSLECAEIAYK